MMRVASPLIALFLLFAAAVAHADCAWVLWGNLTARKSESVQWQRYFVYPTYDACWAKITEATGGVVLRPGSWADTLQRWWGSGQYGSGAGASLVGDQVVILQGERSARWACYPDTVDPRGPKGE